MSGRKPKPWAKLWLCLLTQDEDFRDLCRRHGPMAWTWAGVILAAALGPEQDGQLVRKLGPMTVETLRAELHLSEQFSEQFHDLFRDLSALGWVKRATDGSDVYTLPKFLRRQETPKAAWQREKRESGRVGDGGTVPGTVLGTVPDKRIRGSENREHPPTPRGGDPSATAAGRETSAPPDPEPEVLEVEVVEDETQAEPAAPDEKPKRETEPERPAYVPEDAWTGFLAHRRRRRLPVVGRAGVLLANKLARWHKSGLDVGALLDEATLKGWLSPVDPAERGNGGSHRPAPSSQRGGAELLLERLDAADAARGRLL